jgi:hypothetical protein
MKKKQSQMETDKTTPINTLSETGFVPKIDQKSIAITGDRANNDPEQVYKNLYKDYKDLQEKKENILLDKERRAIEDENNDLTFKPRINHDSLRHAGSNKYKLSKSSKTQSYTDMHMNGRLNQSRSTHLINQKKLQGGQSERWLNEGCYSDVNLKMIQEKSKSRGKE